MKLHPRTLLVQKARNEIERVALGVCERDGLTALELVSIYAQLQANHVKYALRAERHPDDPAKQSDEA